MLPKPTTRLGICRAMLRDGNRGVVTEKKEPDKSADALSAQVNRNIRDIVAFHEREDEKLGNSERRLAGVSDFIGRPLYLVAVLSLVALWICWNLFASRLGGLQFDPPPFPWLQGTLTLAALITTTIVLIKQNREARIDTHRSQLDLQLNLLTEQKVTKLIHLLEELRHDLPMVKDRHDPEAASLQQRTDTAQVLSALEDVGAPTMLKKGSSES
jgi:uncharacterized membrane protein